MDKNIVVSNVPNISYNEYPKEMIGLEDLSLKFMKQSIFVPLSLENNTLKIAMADPLDHFTIDALKLSYGFSIDICKGESGDILEVIDRLYGSGSQSIETIIEEADRDV